MTRYMRSHGYHSVMRSHRYRPILIDAFGWMGQEKVPMGVRQYVGLALMAAFLIFKVAGVGGINEGNFEAQRNTRLRSEVQHAVSNVNSLSRLGASSTSAMLGRIRQYVHGVEVLNDLNVGMYGEIGRLYDQSVFDNIYSIIEAYDAKLASGQQVSDTLTSLSEAVNQLSDMTTAMLDGADATVSET